MYACMCVCPQHHPMSFEDHDTVYVLSSRRRCVCRRYHVCHHADSRLPMCRILWRGSISEDAWHRTPIRERSGSNIALTNGAVHQLCATSHKPFARCMMSWYLIDVVYIEMQNLGRSESVHVAIVYHHSWNRLHAYELELTRHRRDHRNLNNSCTHDAQVTERLGVMF